MRLYGPINSGVGAGGAGVATNSATSTTPIAGKVLGAYVRYNHSCPATTDVTLSTLGDDPAIPTQTLLALTDANTDGLFLPRVIPQGTDGVDLAALTIAEPIAIVDFMVLEIAGANNGDSADVWLYLE
jgi:hypothetical protein